MNIDDILRKNKKTFLLNDDVYLVGGKDTILQYEDREKIDAGEEPDRHVVVITQDILNKLERIVIKDEGTEHAASAQEVLDYVWDKIEDSPGEAIVEVGDNLHLYVPEKGDFDDHVNDFKKSLGSLGRNPRDKDCGFRIISNQKSVLVHYNRRGFVSEESQFDKVDPALVREGHIEVFNEDLLAELSGRGETGSVPIEVAADALGRAVFEYGMRRRKDSKYLYPNQIVEFPIPGEKQSVFAHVTGKKKLDEHGHATHIDDVILQLFSREEVSGMSKKNYLGVTPRNMQQAVLAHYLNDPTIGLVIGVGGAGTGKTLMGYAASLYQVLHKTGRNPDDEYSQLVFTKSVAPIPGQELGFLKGGMLEKVIDIIASFEDTHKITDIGYDLEKMMQEPDKDYEGLGERKDVKTDVKVGKFTLPAYNAAIKFFPLAYARGRSVSDAITWVDEVQNLDPATGRTFIQRAGNGSKTMLTGDILQVDNPRLSTDYNALIRTIDHAFGHPAVALVRLNEIYRPVQAKIADDMPTY